MPSVSTRLTLNLPSSVQHGLDVICQMKGLERADAAMILLAFGCQIFEDSNPKKDIDLIGDLRFGLEFSRQQVKRLDRILALGEQATLDMHTIQKTLLAKECAMPATPEKNEG